MESQGTRITDVVDDYAELGTWLLEKWSARASTVASRLDAGTYDADSAAADFAAAASLMAESWARLAGEALDCVAILTGRQCEPEIVDSEIFSTTLKGAKLELEGPLVNAWDGPLPTDLIEIIPSQLGAGDTDFRLRADATGYPGDTYLGKVVASLPNGQEEEVTVWITVP
jgi:hypothetical protein